MYYVKKQTKIKNNKFDADLTKFCAYLYLISGRLAYTYYANLK